MTSMNLNTSDERLADACKTSCGRTHVSQKELLSHGDCIYFSGKCGNDCERARQGIVMVVLLVQPDESVP